MIWTLLGILLGVAVGSLLVVLVIVRGKHARPGRWARRGKRLTMRCEGCALWSLRSTQRLPAGLFALLTRW